MKAFIYFWTREDILFAAAVFPAAIIWIVFESALAGLVTWSITYATLVGAYEFVASKKGWPNAAITTFFREVFRFYNPF